APDGSDHALSERVLPRGVRRGEDLGKTDGLHSLSKLSAEDATSLAISESTGGRLFDRVATSNSRTRGNPGGASESRSAAERHGALRATVPTTARATSRRRGRGDRPEVAWSGGGARRAAVAAPGSQERGRCGPSAQRAECPAERVRGTLLRRLARPATYVQSV